MQVCTVVAGNATSMASERPLRPSTTAIRISATPRAFRSLNTLSQNLAPSVCSIQIPSTSRVPSGRTPRARYTALLRTTASSRILTRRASKKITGYIGSSGRLCQAVTSAMTSSVTLLMNSGDTSVAYISAKNPWISRIVIPRAYIATILSSKPVNRRSCLGMIWGSKLPARSRGTSMRTGPSSVSTVLGLLPLRWLLCSGGLASPGE